MKVEHLNRYPVKGLSPEPLTGVDVEAGGALPWDRAFALAQGDAPFDPNAPTWLKKTNFMCLMANAKAAALKSVFDPVNTALCITAPDGRRIIEHPLLPDGRLRLAAWLTAYLKPDARGTPVFHHVPGFVFGDQKTPVVSLLSLSSVADLEQKVGAERHHLRFRANITFSGCEPWAEFDWIGRELIVGSARMRVIKRTVRCLATEVNPLTAQRDAQPVRELMRHFGHADLGIHAEVIQRGHVAPDDCIHLA